MYTEAGTLRPQSSQPSPPTNSRQLVDGIIVSTLTRIAYTNTLRKMAAVRNA